MKNVRENNMYMYRKKKNRYIYTHGERERCKGTINSRAYNITGSFLQEQLRRSARLYKDLKREIAVKKRERKRKRDYYHHQSRSPIFPKNSSTREYFQ